MAVYWICALGLKVTAAANMSALILIKQKTNQKNYSLHLTALRINVYEKKKNHTVKTVQS